MKRDNLVKDFTIVLLVGLPLDKYRINFIEKLIANDEINLIGIIAPSSGELSLIYRLRRLIRKHGLFSLLIILNYIRNIITWERLFQSDSLKNIKYFERRYNIPVFHTIYINSEKVIEIIKRWKPNLGVIYGTRLVKPEIFQLPEKGMIGIHHGKLPEYKGPYTNAFWVLYNDGKETGVTIQQINAGVDTGDIILQSIIPISIRDTIKSLEDKTAKVGVDLLIEAILQVKYDRANPVVQEKRGNTYSWPTFSQWLRLQLKMLRRRFKKS